MSAFGPYDHSGGYSPLASGIPYQQWNPYGSVPGGILGQLGAQMLIDPQMAALGLTPMGMSDAQNMADRVKRQMLTRNYNEIVQRSVGGDEKTAGKILDGFKRALAGGTLSQAETAAANQIVTSIEKAGPSGAAKFILPTAAVMMPGLLDKVMGGSSTVQAANVALASRYRIDPITGRMGMSVDSAARLADNMFNAPAEMNSMKGFLAGEQGVMVDEMTRRGMLPGGMDKRKLAVEALERMKAHSGKTDYIGDAFRSAGIDAGRSIGSLSDKEISTLSDQAEVKTAMRDVDTGKIKGQLKKYAGALAAMKEIFEDNGRTGASVSELFNGLEQMTNGSLSKLDPGRVEMLVRNFNNLAESSGIGLQGGMMMMGNASQTAQRMGLDPIFGMQAVMGGMAFSQAHNATGGNAYAQWGLSNSTQLAKKDTNLRLSAANSQMANQMGLAARISDTGMTFKEGTKAASYIEAVKKGLPIDGMNMNEREFIEMMVQDSGGKLTAEQVSLMLQNKSANQEQISKYNIPDSVRRQQRADVMGFVGEEMSFSVLGALGVVDKDDSIRTDLQKILGDTVGGMDKETRGNTKLRNSTIAKAMKERLKDNPQVKAKLKNMTPEEEREFWEAQAQAAYDAADTGSQEEFNQTIADQLALHDQDTLDKGAEAQYTATGKSIIQSSLAGLGTGNWVTKMSKALQEIDFSKDPDALMKLAGVTFGGIDNEEVKKHLTSAMGNVGKAQQAIKETKEKYMTRMGDARWAGDKEKEAKLKSEYEKELGIQESGLAAAEEEFKKYLDTNEEARAALEAAKKKQEADGEKSKTQQDSEKAATPDSKDMAITGELKIIDSDGTVKTAVVTANGVPKDGTHTGVA